MTRTERDALKKATEELAGETLPVPACIKSFYKKRIVPSVCGGTLYFDYITEHKGRLLQRIFLCEIYGLHSTPVCYEIGRRYEQGDLILSNVENWYGGMYCNSPIFDSKTGVQHGVSGWDPTCLYNREKKDITATVPYFCVNEKEVLAKYPYCGYERFNGYQNLWQYLCAYRRNKSIEYLVKAGYSHFIGVANQLNKKGKTFQEIFGVKQSFAEEYLKRNGPSEWHLLRRYEWLDNETELNRCRSVLQSLRWSHQTLDDDTMKYLVKNGIPYGQYADYVKAATKLGYPLNEKRYRYPNDFKTAHDDATNALILFESAERAAAIAAASEANQYLRYSNDKFSIFPLSCTEDLINESKALGHCVRTYGDDVASGRSLILFVRHNETIDEPYVTVELQPGKNTQRFSRLIQARGDHNETPDDETLEFITEWQRKNRISGTI